MKLLHGAARFARDDNKSVIETLHLSDSFPKYSQERLQDLANEFRSELPQIQDLLIAFKPGNIPRTSVEAYRYTNDSAIKKIRNAMQNTRFEFANGRPASPNSLLEFLYKIDFLIACFVQPDGSARWQYFDQNRYLGAGTHDFGNMWEIHPAYRWALQPRNINEVLDSIMA